MPKTVCEWCNALIEVKRLPRANEVSVCAGTNCGDLENAFRTQFSDANIGRSYMEQTGYNPHIMEARHELGNIKPSHQPPRRR